MGPFPRPIVVTSQCLELAACRYNAQTIRAPFVRALAEHVDLRPICPEIEIGLGVPRDPIRLVRRRSALHLVQPSTGVDVTERMQQFADGFLGVLGDVDGFILKSRSPSCGISDTKIYTDSSARQLAGKGAGLFGAAVAARFPHAAIEDEGRLTNFRIRHHFLTKIFVRAAFRDVRRSQSAAELVAFHAEHKLLLMAQHQTALRRLGRLVAAAGSRPFATLGAEYQAELDRALAAPARVKATVNVLHHALGYFKKGLTTSEKRHFLRLVDRYGSERGTLAGPLAVLQSWIERFGQEYLADQVFFSPYPLPLLDLRDSGHGVPA